jgi:hypothetical protein
MHTYTPLPACVEIFDLHSCSREILPIRNLCYLVALYRDSCSKLHTKISSPTQPCPRKQYSITEPLLQPTQLFNEVVMSSATSPETPTQAVGPDYRSTTQKPTATVSTEVTYDNVHVLPQTPQLIALLT